jgi:DNA-binding NarL/FixJ family response regulator
MMQIWLVEDDPRLRAGLASGLQKPDSGVTLSAMFGSARETLDALRQGPAPDAALVDLGLPDMSGTELIAGMLALRPELVLLALTVRFDDTAIFGALRAGAVGYLLKDSAPRAIVEALQEAVAGGSPMSPSIARRVVRQFQPDTASQASFELTQREREVLELLCSGASYREVAAALGVAEGTVQTHVKRIYDKLGASNKAEAVRIALDARLVPLRNA